MAHRVERLVVGPLSRRSDDIIQRARMTRSRMLFGIVAIVAIVFVAAGVAYKFVARRATERITQEVRAADPFPAGYHQKVEKISALREAAPTSQPSAADSKELFDETLHDPDFRIRVRAMAVLPYVPDREAAIDALIQCVHDRVQESSGGGNVPLYATSRLTDMKAVRAIPDVEDWIRFLENNPPYQQKMLPILLKKSSEDLLRLKGAATRPKS